MNSKAIILYIMIICCTTKLCITTGNANQQYFKYPIIKINYNYSYIMKLFNYLQFRIAISLMLIIILSLLHFNCALYTGK